MRDQQKSFLEKIRSFLRGYRRRYFDYLYYHYRYFNMKGIASQGTYSLAQSDVYVDLNLAPANPDELIAGVVPRQNKTYKNIRRIWGYIDNTSKSGNKLIVVGSPGSGKTTLLKQIVLAFCRFRTTYNLPASIPMILFLRSNVPDIIRNPDILLTDLLRINLSKAEMECNKPWFERKLRRGQCVILLDGLDEIGDPHHREKVVAWIEKQFALYSQNHFILTSRPHGIAKLTIHGADILQILPLEADQIEKFIRDWYWATEKWASQSEDAGVRMIAREGAQDLLSRIQNTDSLHPLAQNALLLTMIATLHRFDAQLPGRRVELYDAIFKVFFRRRDVVGVDLLTSEQSKNVLVPLASYMMEKRKREICLEEAVEIIRKDLAEIGGEHIQPDEFLRGIQNHSGLLLEVAENEFSFASLTFQEYLASVDYVKKNSVEKMVGEIKSDWWWETIRLFCAQADGTRIIDACLADGPIQLDQLQLAIGCLEEALRVEVAVRERLNDIIRQGVDHVDPKWRNAIAEALLFKRLRFMDRIDARQLIDNSLVTNVEYQIFLDQEIERGLSYIPDHWTECRFPIGKALEPVTGVRISDVRKFCEWLVPQDIWRFRYRLPEDRETTVHECDTGGFQYWVFDGKDTRLNNARRDISPRYKDIIIQQMVDDSEVFSSMRSAAERERTTRPTSLLIEESMPVASQAVHSGSGLAGEARAAEVQKGEMARLREWHLLRKFRKFADRVSMDFGQFLECVSVVNVVSKDQVQAFDWMPVFPYPPEYGFDLGKEILDFESRYPETRLRSMLERKFHAAVHAYGLMSKIIRDRSWSQLVADEYAEVYGFIRSVVRMSLLTLAFAGRTKHPALSRDIANIYLTYCLLERRIAGREVPIEGIRLVKFS